MFKIKLNSILILGGLSILGVVVLQVYWIVLSLRIRDNEFHEKIYIALRNVASKMAAESKVDLPKSGLIKQISSNAYLINYNDFIDSDILEDYLIQEFDEVEEEMKFEFAIYDCHSGDLVYCDYCNIGKKTKERIAKKIENIDRSTNYFVTRFPDKSFFLLQNVKLYILVGFLIIMAVYAYLYAVKSIFEQKKLSELQKDFVDNMTHEFKTPLTSIKLASDVIGKSDEIKSNQKLKKYSSIITQQSEKLTSHIERMLDLIRSDTKFKLKKERLELNSFISDFVEKLKDEIEFKDAIIEVTKPGTPNFVEIDKYHFSNVLYNIVENGLKYNNNEKKRINIDIINYKDLVLLSFEDNGIGISKEDLSKIFDKFYRVQKGDVYDTKGFGLGLYYVRNIIDLHGWNIEVSSKPEKGTTFTIQINKSI